MSTTQTPPLLLVNRNPVKANGLSYSLAPGTTAEIIEGKLYIENEYTGEALAIPAPFPIEYVLIVATVKGDR